MEEKPRKSDKINLNYEKDLGKSVGDTTNSWGSIKGQQNQLKETWVFEK